ncbi:MAG TPA: HlyD family secretion protein [Planctomycetaceae bacterium]|nr:HlyD family secretion protein [Planctomycetaceae bacterium]
MPAETSKDPNEGHAKPAPVGDGAAGKQPPAASAAPPPTAVAPKRASARRLTMGVIAIVLLALGIYYTAPTLVRIFNTVSTDDAYVNGHVTSVAARVPGQVMKVFVDDNYRVRKGSLLVQLDKEPYRIQVALKKATYENAEANLVAAYDEVRGLVAQARSNRFKLQHAMEDVDNQIALLRASVASLKMRRANLARSKADYDRAIELQKTPGAIAPQEVDKDREAYDVAQAEVTRALESVYQIRVGLGLPAKPQKPGDDVLSEVPADLDQTYSTVRQALASLLQSVAPLNFFPSSYDITPKQAVEQFYRQDPQGNLDRIYAKLIEDAPAIKLAKAKRDEAKADLDQAELNLRYCDVVAEIDGVITRRNVNPGNNVQAGEGLMALRSLTDIWIDANFKETQLSELRIGQPAELEVDMYGSHKTFKGRISGFTYGTGSTLALLPPQNATGNFIKVVQRLPVRIDLSDYDPDKDPLFIGLSVVPYVYYKEQPEGADAGKRLQAEMTNLPIINPDQLPKNPAPPVAQPTPVPANGTKAPNGGPTRPAP